MNATSVDAARNKLSGDFRAVVTDVEELLKATAGQTGEQLSGARARVSESLHHMKGQLESAERAAVAQVKRTATEVDQYAHTHPWQAVGIAAGVGFLIGVVVAKR
jgi:ElaB/YqjD/DUF883 family membrane-anchored ribosome-binding protein